MKFIILISINFLLDHKKYTCLDMPIFISIKNKPGTMNVKSIQILMVEIKIN